MTGIGGWYDYQQMLTMPHGPFGLSILVWGIIMVSLGSILMIAQMWYRIRTLESDRPSISVKATTSINHEFCLNVTNSGEEGTFEAQIALRAAFLHGCWVSTEDLPKWKGAWAYKNADTQVIQKGHDESIRLVRIGATELDLMGYDLKAKSAVVVKAFDTSLTGPKTRVRMSVVVSSHPSPRNGVFRRLYEISQFDMVEINTSVWGKAADFAKSMKR